jgi:hypothetical protein
MMANDGGDPATEGVAITAEKAQAAGDAQPRHGRHLVGVLAHRPTA